MGQTLPISRLIAVAVNLAPIAAQAQDLSTLLVLGSSSVIDVSERMRTYVSLSGVTADFGTTGPEYNAAVLWFSQTPTPSHLKIGRWAKNATSARLNCAPLTATNSLIATWNAVTAGGMQITIDGVLKSLTGLNFSGATNLNGVATIIGASLTGGTVAYNSSLNRFEFSSSTSGPTSTITVISAGTGTDISTMIGGTTAAGAQPVAGIAAESALTAATLFDSTFGQNWYALMIPEGAVADHTAVAGYIEGSTNKHIYGVTTQDTNVLSSASTTDVAYQLQQLGYHRTFTQYSSSSLYAIASAFGKGITTNFNGQNTVITMMYKQEPGVTAETLSATQVGALETKNCNVFVAYDNATAIFEQGVSAAGDYLDEVTGIDWLATTIMTNLYNLLYTSPTKIPQTDAGVHMLVTTCEDVCSQAVRNGLLGPGTWGVQGFGTLNQGDFMPKGFYVYANPLSSQSSADRSARKAPPIQIAAKLAGAVHKPNVTINVNR